MPLDTLTLARYPNRWFVETGAGTGHGIKTALAVGFERIVSIEFDPDIHGKIERKFASEPKVEVLHGDSAKLLPEVLATINEPATIWLDAHGKTGDTTPDLSMKPLLAELDAIAAHPIKTHTILIDDWDLVVREKVAPHLTEESVREKLAAINPDYKLSRVDGWIFERKHKYWSIMAAEA